MAVFRHILERGHATESAPYLLGATLVHRGLAAEILEVEAYGGAEDPGSHAFHRKTPRNATMYGPPGVAYVYVSYGQHMMLNLVARPENEGSAILIRAARPLSGIEEMRTRRPRANNDCDLLSGPGKLCQAFGIDKRLDGADLFCASGELRIVLPARVVSPLLTRRIGLSPGKGDDRDWRFLHPQHGGYASRSR